MWPIRLASGVVAAGGCPRRRDGSSAPNCLGVLDTDPRVCLNATLAVFRVPAWGVWRCPESGAISWIALLGHAGGLAGWG